jgi:CRISPR-associated protein Cas1
MWLVLQDAQRNLTVRGGALVVEVGGHPVETVRPDEVEQVHVYGNAGITPAARGLCLQAGIDVVFFCPSGRFRGRLCGDLSPAGERRLAQLRAVSDPSTRLGVARAIVSGKLLNQRSWLLRVQRAARSEVLADALAAIRSAAERAREAPSIESLLGLEGAGARAYFGVMHLALRNPLFSFTDRNRRPPRDPVNAALSFLYTMLCGLTLRAVQGAGLDPYVGFLHEAGRGRSALAFDLAEEWRPLIDALVMSLFNLRQLSPEDFGDPERRPDDLSEPMDEEEPEPQSAESAQDPRPPVHLTKLGRSIVILAFHRRLRERLYHAPSEGRYEIAEILRLQARHLARVVEGRDTEYHPFEWT